MNFKKLLDMNSIVEDYKSCKNAAAVGRKHNVCGPTITKVLTKAGVDVRHVIKNKKLNLSSNDNEKFTELIDGLLLGDACIDKQGSLRIEQSQKRSDWLKELRSALENFGVVTRINQVQHINKYVENTTKTYDLLYTLRYAELKKHRARWYKDGNKQVPSDVQMTPIVLTNWFAGDGTYDRKGTLKFCTDGFLKKDVMFLISRLKEIFDIHSSISMERENQYRLNLYRQDEVLKLKTIILPYLSECCHYKLKYVKEIPTTIIGG